MEHLHTTSRRVGIGRLRKGERDRGKERETERDRETDKTEIHWKKEGQR